MRLHSLQLTGIGPFKATQVIDFDELSSSGLFLIEGPTGSGKTTIIDAIVYALFGVVSGGSDDVTRMRIRSSYCDDADPTGVACEFSVDGRRHRITRVPAGCRDPEDPTRKATSKGPRQVLTELASDGSPLSAPLAARKDVDARIEELLGMTAEQFRQLVVLPQGQFAELLRKTPAERLSSLAPLLEDGFIALVQEDLRARGDVAHAQRNEAAAHVDRSAQRLAGRLKSELAEDPDLVDFTDSTSSDDARRHAVAEHLRLLTERAASAASERQAQELLTDRLRDAAASSGAVLTVLQEISEARERVTDARESLDPEDAGLSDTDIPGRVSDLRRLEGSLESHAEWEEQAQQRAADRAALTRQQAEHAARAEELRTELAGHPGLTAELHSRREEAAALAVLLPARRLAEDDAARLLDTARQLAERRTTLDRAATALRTARDQQATASANAEAAQRAWEQLARDHRAGTAASLAGSLVPGEPCPVCGSCDHPHPADPDASDITRSDLDDAVAAASRARAVADESTRAAADAAQDHAEAATAVAVLEGVLAERSFDDLVEHQRAAREARLASEAAEMELPTVLAQLNDLQQRESGIHAGILEAETAAATVQATLVAAETAEGQRAEQIAAIAGGFRSAGALLHHTRSRISALTALAHAAAGLSECMAKVPEEQRGLSVDEAVERAAADEARYTEATGILATLADRSAALAAAETEAAPLARAFTSALDTQADVIRDTAAPIELATLVSAGNSRRLQLRAYALQRRFESVLAAASIQLERMSSGKFTFVATDEAARGQSGLGIHLLDAWTGHLQDPRSLSGGETFYASLALALGLAEVVRGEAGGAQLETLFVDEGFGSLDQDTLYQVLEQLDRLRAGNRAVGVVSHVSEMKESIPDRLEVRRQSDSTSTISRAS